MSQWQVIDLLRFDGELHGERGHLIVGTRSVPLSDIAVVLVGLSVHMSGGLLVRLAEADIVVITCDWRGVPVGGHWPWSSNTRTGARIAAQRELDEHRRGELWADLVTAKIAGQAANLEWVAPDVADRLRILATDVPVGDPSNLEARAARMYWECVFDDFGFLRDQAGLDPRNAALNYGYTVLRGFMLQAICSTGLMPGLGIHHSNRTNPFALVDDLMEPLRPAVDAIVVTLGNEFEMAKREVRQSLVGVLSAPIGSTGATVRTAITSLATSFAYAIEYSGRDFIVPVWSV